MKKAYIAEFIDSDGDIIHDLQSQLRIRNIEIVTDSLKTHECDYIFVVPTYGANLYNGDFIQVSEELTLFLKRIGPKRVIVAKECNKLFKGVKIDESHLSSNYLDVESNKLSYDQLFGEQENDLVCVNPKPVDMKRVFITTMSEYDTGVVNSLFEELKKYNVQVTHDEKLVNTCDYVFVVPSTNYYNGYDSHDTYPLKGVKLNIEMYNFLKNKDLRKVFYVDKYCDLHRVGSLGASLLTLDICMDYDDLFYNKPLGNIPLQDCDAKVYGSLSHKYCDATSGNYYHADIETTDRILPTVRPVEIELVPISDEIEESKDSKYYVMM